MPCHRTQFTPAAEELFCYPLPVLINLTCMASCPHPSLRPKNSPPTPGPMHSSPSMGSFSHTLGSSPPWGALPHFLGQVFPYLRELFPFQGEFFPFPGKLFPRKLFPYLRELSPSLGELFHLPWGTIFLSPWSSSTGGTLPLSLWSSSTFSGELFLYSSPSLGSSSTFLGELFPFPGF